MVAIATRPQCASNSVVSATRQPLHADADRQPGRWLAYLVACLRSLGAVAV